MSGELKGKREVERDGGREGVGGKRRRDRWKEEVCDCVCLQNAN